LLDQMETPLIAPDKNKKLRRSTAELGLKGEIYCRDWTNRKLFKRSLPGCFGSAKLGPAKLRFVREMTDQTTDPTKVRARGQDEHF